MAGRAPGEVARDDAQQALYRQLDYFPTPPWAARAGGELVRHLDPEALTIWEPACGEGHMAAALAESFLVFATDIHPFGYGEPYDFLGDSLEPIADFLDDAVDRGEVVDWIVTNPPFRTAGDFIRLGLRRARRGVAMLLRVQFLEGVGRYRLLHGAEPLTACAVFAERVPMTLGRWDPAQASATCYAWFLWRKGDGGGGVFLGLAAPAGGGGMSVPGSTILRERLLGELELYLARTGMVALDTACWRCATLASWPICARRTRRSAGSGRKPRAISCATIRKV